MCFQKIKTVLICGPSMLEDMGGKEMCCVMPYREVFSGLWIESFGTFSLRIFEFLGERGNIWSIFPHSFEPAYLFPILAPCQVCCVSPVCDTCVWKLCLVGAGGDS